MQIITVIALLSIPISYLLFLKGFFPLKDVANGYSTNRIIPSIGPTSFPVSSHSHSDSSPLAPNSNPLDLHPNSEFNSSASPIYQRVVLMIIDALRDDFMKAELDYLPKTISHLRRGHGLAFTAQTQPPTVTLPRIKAITTGSIPGFIDVVLNFGSTALSEDSIVKQMKINNKKIIFFGDDTWVNLFPDHFHSYDGTSSFFVTDYTEVIGSGLYVRNLFFDVVIHCTANKDVAWSGITDTWPRYSKMAAKEDKIILRIFIEPKKPHNLSEVDDNVTRHLSSQLQPDVNWDVMILHYLGLDHIGHVSGPNSPLVRPKMREMDAVIDRIYSAMETWESESGVSSVLVVCGDHGMSDQGGHGGSSPPETLVPLVFLSPTINTKDSFNKGLVSQTDLCPTLAVFLGLPVPLNSLGKVIQDTLVGYSLPQKVSVLYQNTQHVLRIFKNFVKQLEKESAYILYKSALEEQKKWLDVDKTSVAEHQEWEKTGNRLLGLYSESLSLMAEKVGKLSSQYDVYAMMTSITMLWLILISILVSRLKKDLTLPEPSLSKHLSIVTSIIGSAFMSHIIMCTSGLPSALMCGTSPLNIGVQLFVAGVLVCCVIHLALACSTLATWKHQVQFFTKGVTLMELFLVPATFCHTLTLLSSSFVEEEHQTFYFITTSIHLLFLGHIGFMFIRSRRLLDGHNNTGRVGHSKSPATYNSIFYTSDVQHSEKTTERDEVCSHNSQDIRDDCFLDYSNMEISNPREADNNVDSVYLSKTSASNLVNNVRELQRNGDNKKESKSGVIEMAETDAAGVEYVSVISPKEALHTSISVVVILVFLRVLRRWNQTGDKWINVPDFGDWLVNPDHKPTLSLVVLLCLVLVSASRSLSLPTLHTMCANLSLVCTYMSRAASGSLIFPDKRFISSSGVIEARASYIFIGLTVILSMLPPSSMQEKNDDSKEPKETLLRAKAIKPGKNLTESQLKKAAPKSQVNTSKSSHEYSSASSQPAASERKEKNLTDLFRVDQDLYSSLLECHRNRRVHFMNGVTTAWLCFMCLVLRPHNIPVVALMALTEQMAVYAVVKMNIKPVCVLLYSLWMGQAFFFFQGNSNSLSTVDVTAGYVGLTDYNPVAIGLLMALSTYSGLIFWLLSFLRIMCFTYSSGSDATKRLKQILRDSLVWLSLAMLFPLAVYCVVVATQRYHLFVWTVFSPKLLYQAMETVVLSAIALGFYCVQHFVA